MRLPLWLAVVGSILPVLSGGGFAVADEPIWGQGLRQTAGAWNEFPAGSAGFHAGGPPAYGTVGGGPPGWIAFPDAVDYPTHTPVPLHDQGGSLPPNIQPWPTISPFENRLDQTYQGRDGLWYRLMSNELKKHVILEAMVTRYRRPSGAYIGAMNVEDQIFYRPTAQALGFSPHSPANLRETMDPVWDETTGIRVRFGHTEPDGSGMELIGWWGGEYGQTVVFGNLNARITDPTQLRADNPGLPLEDDLGPFPSAIFSDNNAAYDRGVAISYSEKAFGGSLTWLFSRKVDVGALKARPTVGIRYLGIHESLGFLGRGSGLNITVPFPPGTFATGVLGTLGPPFEGNLYSSVWSHMIGPEIGMRIDLGGDNLKFISETKFALAGVYEETIVKSKGLGNGFNPLYDPELTTADSGHHGHVSPIFEYTISAEANVFGYMPCFKDCSVFEKAKVRVGYTFLWTSEVQRPSSIRYLPPSQGRGGPQIEFDRKEWYMNVLNVGASWEY